MKNAFVKKYFTFYDNSPLNNAIKLGIILIREFVDKNGGDLHIESKPGEGTDFRVTLPGGDYNLG